MGVFTWFDGPVPKNLKIRQVYGLLFSEDGRLLIRKEKENGKERFSLAGGTPEFFDNGAVETLRRECLEEVNTTLQEDIFVVGYQLVDEGNGKPVYAQLRMTAKIDKIGPKKPDPDGGQIYDRLLTPPERASELLNWGEVGEKMVHRAVEVAKEHFGITKFSEKEEYI